MKEDQIRRDYILSGHSWIIWTGYVILAIAIVIVAIAM